MVGVQYVKISNERVIFEFDLYRKVTIIRGDSATGKTILYDLVAQHNREAGNPSKLVVQSTKKCYAFKWRMRSTNVDGVTDSIIFIDEVGAERKNHKKLAELISNSDNYFVIIYRDDIEALPRCIAEICKIKSLNKYTSPGKIYNQLDRDNTVTTEDSSDEFE